MIDTRRFGTNQNEVAAKVIDGEAIIMNIANGAYYSITGSGAAVWEGIEQGMSVDSVIESLLARYDAPPDVVHEDVSSLVAMLIEEGLIIETTSGAEPSRPVESAAVGRAPYQPPVFEKFTDMADMLALDPPMPGFDETPWAEAGDASAQQG